MRKKRKPRKKREVVRALTKGVHIRIPMWGDRFGPGAVVNPPLYRDADGMVYQDAGTVGAGIAIVRDPLEKMFKTYGRELSEEVFEVYLAALAELEDSEWFAAIPEAVARNEGHEPPSPGDIRAAALDLRGRKSRNVDEKVAMQDQLARNRQSIPKGSRNKSICRAWDQAGFPVFPQEWIEEFGVRNWVEALAHPKLQNRVNKRIYDSLHR